MPSSDVVERDVRGSRILVPLSHDTARLDSVYTLNATAAFIWDRARAGAPEHDIVTALTLEFDVDTDCGTRDVAAILNDLKALGALKSIPDQCA
jgi:hypothetical protein